MKTGVTPQAKGNLKEERIPSYLGRCGHNSSRGTRFEARLSDCDTVARFRGREVGYGEVMTK